MYNIFNLTFLSNTICTLLTLFTLFLFWFACLSIIINDDDDDININKRIFNILPDKQFIDSTIFLPKGIYGIFTSLMYATWFFIAIEELPLAAEDAINPKKNIPKSLILSIIILTICSFLTLIFSVLVPGGSYNISNTGTPLVRALTAGYI